MSDQLPSEDEKTTSFLHKRVYHYDQFGDLLHIAQPRRWVFIGALMILLLAILIWAFFGSIPTEVTGKMIAVHPDSLLSFSSKNEGMIDTIQVKEGEEVPAGTLLGTVYNPGLQAIIYKIRVDRKKLVNLREEIELIEANLSIRERLYKEGLIARTVVDNTRIDLLTKKSSLDDVRGEISNLFSELEKTSQYWDISIPKDPDNPESYDALTIAEDHLSNLYAPEGVKILEIFVEPREYVKKNQQLFWFERTGDKKVLQFYTAVPIEQGSKLRLGMKAYLEPYNINNQEYGKLIGTVTAIYPFTASEEEFLSTIKNPQIVKYLTENGKPSTLVSIEGDLDSTTASGYAWTSKSGPPFPIASGTVGIVSIVVEEQPPISYLIPLWKLKPY